MAVLPLCAQLQDLCVVIKKSNKKKVNTKMKRIILLIVVFAALTVAGKFNAYNQQERSLKKSYDY